MPPKTPSTDREDDRYSDERVDRDAQRSLRRDEPEGRDAPNQTREEIEHDEARSARHDRDDEPKHEEATAADKLAAEVEPKTNAVEAVETLVRNVVDEMRTAPDAHELGEHFSGEARRLAEAALAGTNMGGGTAAPAMGFNAAELANGDQRPHNHEAVEAAVAHGMDRDEARAMTGHGSNS